MDNNQQMYYEQNSMMQANQFAQQQMPGMNQPFQGPPHSQNSNILFLTNPDAELYKLELTFRSKYEDMEGNIQSTGNPLMNEHGIIQVIGMVRAIVNQVTVMSCLNKKDLEALRNFMADKLAIVLMVNHKTFGITNPTARDTIYFESITTAHICMKRAFEDSLNDKKFWRGSMNEGVMRVENINQQKKGGLGGMFSKMWGG